MIATFPFLLEKAEWPVLVVDEFGHLVTGNRTARRKFSVDIENGSAHLAEIWAQENATSAENFVRRLPSATASIFPLKLKLTGGRTSSFTACVCPQTESGKKEFVIQFFQAAAQPRQGNSVEASLAHKQKLDCALQLARSVASDFNNALTSIFGHASLLLRQLGRDEQCRPSLLQIEKAAAKAAEVAHDLAMFSSGEKESQTHTPGNLNALLRRTLEIFQSSTVHSIQWEVRFEKTLYSAQFDEAKMQQAFIKVFENAVDALGHESVESRRICVSTCNLDADRPFVDQAARIGPGHYVCVEIADNGVGIPLQELPRVFEPFFTTKSDPHRGLGLAWVYGILTNHEGGVAIASEPGRGTSVRLYIPAQARFVRDSSSDHEDLSGCETVLVVDDDELVLTMAEAVLSSYGYRVLVAESGEKAIEVFRSAHDQIALVITDVVMPQISGRELGEHLLRLAPELKLIYSSGYVQSLHSDLDETYLPKPFTANELLQKVKEVLH